MGLRAYIVETFEDVLSDGRDQTCVAEVLYADNQTVLKEPILLIRLGCIDHWQFKLIGELEY